MMTGSCSLCGSDCNLETHHTRYDPPETIRICRSCHLGKIHTQSDAYSHLKPDDESGYSPDQPVDTARIPSRPGWSVTIKRTTCNRDACSECPHGPYYYYVRRRGDSVEWDYGGVVPDEWFMQQPTLDTFHE
jgi:hypothetical protein